jgi:hypothetical protein
MYPMMQIPRRLHARAGGTGQAFFPAFASPDVAGPPAPLELDVAGSMRKKS